MKLKLTALVVGAFLTTMFSTTAYADDFDRHQMNYQVNFADDWHVRYRSYTEGLNETGVRINHISKLVQRFGMAK